ncbi:MAG: hypothetical protein JG774_1205 [Desulfomicrobiaceae bacterium]|jgi:hypothetical protein|nr:hypothetical protein [Desulfomicrobiaceae bacterium]
MGGISIVPSNGDKSLSGNTQKALFLTEAAIPPQTSFMPFMDYLRAAPLPHLTALKTVALGLGIDVWLSEASALLRPLLAAAAGWVVLLCQADALCRYHEYLRLRRMLERYGFHPRIFTPMLGSRCQRDAALLAARKTGHLEAAWAMLRAHGYRAYHLIPDSVRRDPHTPLRPAFWRTTLLPRRRSRGRNSTVFDLRQRQNT